MTPTSDPNQVLRDAADLIETKGWAQPYNHGFQEVPEGMCADVAIACTKAQAKAKEKARRKLYLALSHYNDEITYGPTIWAWNDNPHRTKAEVLAMLRQLAETP